MTTIDTSKLEILTRDNCERASTIICLDHPEWDTKRFNFDLTHGHHSHGTGSNSALLFESEFSRWAIVSYLPSAEERAAESAARFAYLDANVPGWREKAARRAKR